MPLQGWGYFYDFMLLKPIAIIVIDVFNKNNDKVSVHFYVFQQLNCQSIIKDTFHGSQ